MEAHTSGVLPGEHPLRELCKPTRASLPDRERTAAAANAAFALAIDRYEDETRCYLATSATTWRTRREIDSISFRNPGISMPRVGFLNGRRSFGPTHANAEDKNNFIIIYNIRSQHSRLVVKLRFNVSLCKLVHARREDSPFIDFQILVFFFLHHL